MNILKLPIRVEVDDYHEFEFYERLGLHCDEIGSIGSQYIGVLYKIKDVKTEKMIEKIDKEIKEYELEEKKFW